MAAGLELHTISSGGGDVYVSNTARFDFTGIRDATLKQQAIQALDLGIEHRNGSSLMTTTVDALEHAESRGVRYFSVRAEATAGIPGGASGDEAEGGESFWFYQGGWNKLDAPILRRQQMRVFLNPTGGAYSPNGRGFPYNRLVQVIWHEMHHLTTTQHHIRQTAPYNIDGQPPDPWVGAMLQIKAAFPPRVRDPATGNMVSMLSAEGFTFNNRIGTSTNVG